MNVTLLSDAERYARHLEEIRERRRAADRLVVAAAAGDWNDFGKNWELGTLSRDNAIRAFKRIAKLPKVPYRFQKKFLHHWVTDGDCIRGTVPDLVLIDAFRKLLPQYEGGPVTLYRGDAYCARKTRTYGLAWSSTREIAAGHAQGIWRTYPGGSCILKTTASSEAIISAPALCGNFYNEDEYLVDRRLLGAVEVLERFAELPIESTLLS